MHRYGGLPAWLAALAVLALCGVPVALPRRGDGGGGRAGGRGSRRRAALFSRRSGCWLSWPAASSSLAFPGSRAAMRRSIRRSRACAVARRLRRRRGRRGGWPRPVGFSPAASARARGWRRVARWSSPLVAGALLGRSTTRADPRPRRSRCCRATSRRTKSSRRAPGRRRWMATATRSRRRAASSSSRPETVIPLLPKQLDRPTGRTASRAFGAGPGRDPRHADGRPERGLHQLGGRALGPSTALPGGHYRYDKHHLVPFGEFVPTGFRWFTAMMNIPLGDFNRGPRRRRRRSRCDGERVAPNICYEDLFGEELAARFVPAASAPTILANMSNIAWFGRHDRDRPAPAASRACARSSCSGRCCAPPTPAPPR